MENPLQEWRRDLATRNRTKIFEVLLDLEWHQYSDLIEKTKLAKSTLSKYLDELVERRVVLRKVDTASEQWPIPVRYKLGLGIPAWDMLNIALKGGLLNQVRDLLQEQENVFDLYTYLVHLDKLIDLMYIVLCGWALKQERENYTVSEVTFYALNELQEKIRRIFFEELQSRERKGENIVGQLQKFEKVIELVDQQFAREMEKEGDLINEKLSDYMKLEKWEDLAKEWSKIYGVTLDGDKSKKEQET